MVLFLQLSLSSCVVRKACTCMWHSCHSSTISYSVLLVCLRLHCWLSPPLYVHAAPISSVSPSAPSSPSSQSGAPTADNGPSTEMASLTAAQQGMLHAVSLHMSAPHSVMGVPPVTDDCSCDDRHPNKGFVLTGPVHINQVPPVAKIPCALDLRLLLSVS